MKRNSKLNKMEQKSRCKVGNKEKQKQTKREKLF